MLFNYLFLIRKCMSSCDKKCAKCRLFDKNIVLRNGFKVYLFNFIFLENFTNGEHLSFAAMRINISTVIPVLLLTEYTVVIIILLLSISTHRHLIDDYVPCMRGVKQIIMITFK